MIAYRVLGVSASPRRGGNTEDAIMEALATAQQLGHQIEFERLGDFHIRRCIGCRECMRLGHCALRDDEFEASIDPWRHNDILILGSPVYWLAPCGLLKDFMDRSHGWYREGGIFRGKKALLISVAADSGFEPHDESITAWLKHYGAEVVSVTHVLAREKGEFTARPEEVEKVRQAVREALQEVK
ncbi:MAG: flavodoxin family protein [Candidatus Zipacnadales bacterium]